MNKAYIAFDLGGIKWKINVRNWEGETVELEKFTVSLMIQ